MTLSKNNKSTINSEGLVVLIVTDFGCAVKINAGSPMTAPLSESGLVLDKEWHDLTAPCSQYFLDQINTHFGTEYIMKNFAGR